MPKISKVIKYNFQELSRLKTGIPIDKTATVIVEFPVGDLVIANGKMTFNTKR